jgi:hypothetical protein
MMVTVSELEAVIAQTPSGEQVQFDTKLIGSVIVGTFCFCSFPLPLDLEV